MYDYKGCDGFDKTLLDGAALYVPVADMKKMNEKVIVNEPFLARHVAH